MFRDFNWKKRFFTYKANLLAMFLSFLLIFISAYSHAGSTDSEGQQNPEYDPSLTLEYSAAPNGSGDSGTLSNPPLYTICGGVNGPANCLTAQDPPNVITLTARDLKATQLWYYNYVGNSGGSQYFNVINYKTGLCMDILVNPMDNGAKLTSSTCCQQCTSQWWRKTKNHPIANYQNLRALPSGKCAEAPALPPGVENWSGEPIWQQACGGWESRPNQFFMFLRI